MRTQVIENKVALVTGGNRGIGLEVCRGLAQAGAHVIVGARDVQAGERAAESLRKSGETLQITVEALDVSNPGSIREFTERLGDSVDILVNNAGILDRDPFVRVPEEEITATLNTNLRGPILLAQCCSTGMIRRGWGRIVNVTSMMASVTNGLGSDSVLYRVSKAALNAFTICLAQDLKGKGILVNSVDPGWVRTNMGGPNARRAPHEGASGILWAATLPDSGPTGGFFRDGKPLPW